MRHQWFYHLWHFCQVMESCARDEHGAWVLSMLKAELLRSCIQYIAVYNIYIFNTVLSPFSPSAMFESSSPACCLNDSPNYCVLSFPLWGPLKLNQLRSHNSHYTSGGRRKPLQQHLHWERLLFYLLASRKGRRRRVTHGMVRWVRW